MKKIFVLFIAIVLLITFLLFNFSNLSFVNAEFTKGNNTAYIEEKYSPGDILKGWINISLENEPAESMLTAFNDNITILDFLENLVVDYSCYPVDCNGEYSYSSKSSSKTFSLSSGQEKIIGLKIGGEDVTINDFSADITTDVGESTVVPLKIDILNNKEIEWEAYSPSGNFGNKIYGCFSSGSENAEITQDQKYCQKTTIQVCPNIKIGAEVEEEISGTDVEFEMSLYYDDFEYIDSCYTAASGNGEISCAISDFKIQEEKDFFVCINTRYSTDNNRYSIASEQSNPCGFVGENYETYTRDFEIFAKQGKYAPIGTFTLDDTELENSGSDISYLGDYIDNYEFGSVFSRYSGNCSQGCIIPIRFISRKQQTITVSNADLNYVSGISKTEDDLYNLEKDIPGKINMDFQKLDLEQADLEVPTSYGDKDLVLELGGEKIVEQEIYVSRVPVIERITPTKLPAAISVKFTAYASEGNITKYIWDFGDGTGNITTNENFVYHTYGSVGNYNLKLTAENNLGSATETFFVEVTTPKDAINYTLTEKWKNLNDTKKQINNITAWYKNNIETFSNIDTLESSLRSLEQKFSIASTSSEYTVIMANLTELDVPRGIKISESSSGKYSPEKTEINPEYLSSIGLGEVENTLEFQEAILSWMYENIEIEINRKVYSLVHDSENQPVLTAFSIKVSGKTDYNKDFYVVLDKSYDDLIFKDNYGERPASQGTSMRFSSIDIDEIKTIEVIHPDKIEMRGLPVYISPEFSDLPEVQTSIGPCNFNGECEEELGENWKTCRADCKPWGWVIFLLVILLCVAFAAYIGMQEWYKRYYEKHLFKDKSELYNLVFFINNALNQKMSREEIFSRLESSGWKKEQIKYAWKKYHGQRAGMWEIPVFKWVENKKVKQEIQKRQQNKQNQQNPTGKQQGTGFSNFRKFGTKV